MNTNHSWERRGWEGWRDGSRREKRRQRRRGDEVEAGGVLVHHWSTAPPRLPLPHPLCDSFTSPRLSVIFNSPSHLLPLSLRSSPSPPKSSQLKKTKRAEARGESKSHLSHGEIERNSDGEQSERGFSFFLLAKMHVRFGDDPKKSHRIMHEIIFFKWQKTPCWSSHINCQCKAVLKLLEDVYYHKIFALKCQKTTVAPEHHQEEWLLVPLLKRQQNNFCFP